MSGMAQEMGVLAGDLSEAVLDCATPVVVIRAYPSSVVKGRASDPIEREFITDLAVQPLSNKELKMLPEGMRNDNRVKAFGCVELKTVVTSKCRVPDKFEYKGNTYQIDKVADWSDAGGYYRFEAVRVNR